MKNLDNFVVEANVQSINPTYDARILQNKYGFYFW